MSPGLHGVTVFHSASLTQREHVFIVWNYFSLAQCGRKINIIGSVWCYRSCTWKIRSRKSLQTNISERKGHSEKLGYIDLQMKSPLLTVMQITKDFLISRKGWNVKALWAVPFLAMRPCSGSRPKDALGPRVTLLSWCCWEPQYPWTLWPFCRPELSVFNLLKDYKWHW